MNNSNSVIAADATYEEVYYAIGRQVDRGAIAERLRAASHFLECIDFHAFVSQRFGLVSGIFLRCEATTDGSGKRIWKPILYEGKAWGITPGEPRRDSHPAVSESRAAPTSLPSSDPVPFGQDGCPCAVARGQRDRFPPELILNPLEDESPLLGPIFCFHGVYDPERHPEGGGEAQIRQELRDLLWLLVRPFADLSGLTGLAECFPRVFFQSHQALLSELKTRDWVLEQGKKLGMFIGVHYLDAPPPFSSYIDLPTRDPPFQIRFPILCCRQGQWEGVAAQTEDKFFSTFGYVRGLSTSASSDNRPEFLEVLDNQTRRSDLEKRLGILFVEDGEATTFLLEEAVHKNLDRGSHGTAKTFDQLLNTSFAPEGLMNRYANEHGLIDKDGVPTPRLRRMCAWLKRYAAPQAAVELHSAPGCLADLHERGRFSDLSSREGWFDVFVDRFDWLDACANGDLKDGWTFLREIAWLFLTEGRSLDEVRKRARFNLLGHGLMRCAENGDCGESKSILGFEIVPDPSKLRRHCFLGTFADLDELAYACPYLFESRVLAIKAFMDWAAQGPLLRFQTDLENLIKSHPLATPPFWPETMPSSAERFVFDGIVGQSPRMLKVIEDLRILAQTSTNVLIEGKTGSGKEAIARALHHNGPRKNRPFIAVNCAALAENLLESELFGHEKGSFTSAVGQRLGRFELADGGTIFLDEIGDVPAAMQAKLLRVLQERRFERVGGTQSIEVNVRVIAATNRSLLKLVKGGTFREDLYYRLNVIKIDLPLLRERTEDIPALAIYFVRKYTSSGQAAKQIAPRMMELLVTYRWRGNIRELQNTIESMTVMDKDGILDLNDLQDGHPLHRLAAGRNRRAHSNTLPTGSGLGSVSQPSGSATPVERDIEVEAWRTKLKAIQEALETNSWKSGEAAKFLNKQFREYPRREVKSAFEHYPSLRNEFPIPNAWYERNTRK